MKDIPTLDSYQAWKDSLPSRQGIPAIPHSDKTDAEYMADGIPQYGGLTPNDRKAMRLCAKMIGADPATFNPIANDKHAAALADALALEAIPASYSRANDWQNGGKNWAIVKGGVKVRMEFGNFTRNLALVYGACYAADWNWQDH